MKKIEILEIGTGVALVAFVLSVAFFDAEGAFIFLFVAVAGSYIQSKHAARKKARHEQERAKNRRSVDRSNFY